MKLSPVKRTSSTHNITGAVKQKQINETKLNIQQTLNASLNLFFILSFVLLLGICVVIGNRCLVLLNIMSEFVF
jgi:hypothetical protein